MGSGGAHVWPCALGGARRRCFPPRQGSRRRGRLARRARSARRARRCAAAARRGAAAALYCAAAPDPGQGRRRQARCLEATGEIAPRQRVCVCAGGGGRGPFCRACTSSTREPSALPASTSASGSRPAGDGALARQASTAPRTESPLAPAPASTEHSSCVVGAAPRLPRPLSVAVDVLSARRGSSATISASTIAAAPRSNRGPGCL